jgi:hypothetical protein
VSQIRLMPRRHEQPANCGANVVAIVYDQDTHGPRTAIEKAEMAPLSLLNSTTEQFTNANVLARPSNVVFHARQEPPEASQYSGRQRFRRSQAN